MKKLFYYLLLSLFLFSCGNENDPQPIEQEVEPSTLTVLNYPLNVGSSGDKSSNLLGYGYDATGYCDTTSVREKVLNMESFEWIGDHVNSGYSNLFSGSSFTELSNKLNYANVYESGLVLTAHLKSLLKMAFQTDSMDSKYSFAYYSCMAVSPRFYFFGSTEQYQNAVTTSFKQDIKSLSAQNLVSKYGTHILTNVVLGKKFEVLYRYENKQPVSSPATVAEHGLFKRMKQFFGGVARIYSSEYEEPLSSSNEQLIYNTIGLSPRKCGVIKTTDKNPQNIALNIYSSFSADNNYSLVIVGKNGITPLYDLISDPTKKQEVQSYIEHYMASKSDMKQ